MSNFTIVSGDDWSGLYVNGEVVTQGHSLRDRELLELARDHGPVTQVTVVEADLDWLADEGWLPDRLEEVKLA